MYVCMDKLCEFVLISRIKHEIIIAKKKKKNCLFLDDEKVIGS